MTDKRPKSRVTLLSSVLQSYLETHHMKQQPLADYLSVDIRTLGRWLRGETVIHDIRELKRLANLLDVEPEALGVAASLYLPLTLEQIDETIELVWTLIHQARYTEGRVLINKLLKELTRQISTEDPLLLTRLARAHHVAGHVTSESSRTENVIAAFQHFQQTEQIARTINDDTLLNIALTYEGDMLRRKGDVKGGLQYLLEARDHTPNADKEARGNSLQLLARASLNRRDMYSFEHAMAEAEEISADSALFTGSTHGFYSLGAVYEEYGKSYGWAGQREKALRYLDLADAQLPKTAHWEIVLNTARAMTLVRGGEVSEGTRLAVDATLRCHQTGNFRMLERVYSIQNYLEQLTQDIGSAKAMVRDALLNGPIEYLG
jgi:transcriptional regulator with XRE-family HTH domain